MVVSRNGKTNQNHVHNSPKQCSTRVLYCPWMCERSIHIKYKWQHSTFSLVKAPNSGTNKGLGECNVCGVRKTYKMKKQQMVDEWEPLWYRAFQNFHQHLTLSDAGTGVVW